MKILVLIILFIITACVDEVNIFGPQAEVIQKKQDGELCDFLIEAPHRKALYSHKEIFWIEDCPCDQYEIGENPFKKWPKKNNNSD